MQISKSAHNRLHVLHVQIYWAGPMIGGAAAALLYKWALARKWECCSPKRAASQYELAGVRSEDGAGVRASSSSSSKHDAVDGRAPATAIEDATASDGL